MVVPPQRADSSPAILIFLQAIAGTGPIRGSLWGREEQQAVLFTWCGSWYALYLCLVCPKIYLDGSLMVHCLYYGLSEH